jgi:hypothetical protein
LNSVERLEFQEDLRRGVPVEGVVDPLATIASFVRWGELVVNLLAYRQTQGAADPANNGSERPVRELLAREGGRKS